MLLCVLAVVDLPQTVGVVLLPVLVVDVFQRLHLQVLFLTLCSHLLLLLLEVVHQLRVLPLAVSDPDLS